MGASPIVVLFAVAYFAVLFSIGYFTRKAGLSAADYMVAGRKVGAFVNGAALASTYLSAASFLGLPAFIFLLGYPFWWALTSIILGMPIASMLAAAPLRKYAPVSFTDYYADRYDDQVGMRVVISLPVIVSGILYITLNLIGTAIFLMAILKIPYVWSLVIAAGVVLFYVYLGGMVATTWSNAFQGVVMAIAAVIAGLAAISFFGGLNELGNAIYQNNPKFWNPPHSPLGTASPLMATWTGMVSFFFVWHFGFATMPYTVVRFFTTMDINTARRSIFWATLLGGCMYWGLMVIGSAAKVLIEKFHPLAQQIGAKSAVDVLKALQKMFATTAATANDYSMIAAVEALKNDWLMGILVAGGLSVAMSTVAGWLVVMNVILGRDWMTKIFKVKWAQENPVGVLRMWSVILTVVCFLIALNPPGMILDLSGWAFVVIIATIGPPLILGIWWDRATRAATYASVFIFLPLTLFSWIYARNVLKSPHWFFLNNAFGWKIATAHQDYWIFISFIVFIIISLLTRPPKPEVIQKYSLDLRQD